MSPRQIVLCVLLLAANAGGAVSQTLALRELYESSRRQAPPPTSPVSRLVHKLDPILSQHLLAAQPRLRSASSADATKRMGRQNSPLLAVRIYAEKLDFVPSLKALVLALRGDVISIGEYGVISARVPAETIEEISRTAGVDFVAPQVTVSPMAAPSSFAGALSTYIRAMGVEQLHARGVLGRGVKIGIVDFGFGKYDELQGRKLVLPTRPERDGIFSYRRFDNENNPHGTVCSEILAAVAPAAELYRALIGTSSGEADLEQFEEAIEWLAVKGVDLILFAGGTYSGPSDERDPFAKAVNELSRRYHALFITANGNEGLSHWMAEAVDKNQDGWLDINDPEHADAPGRSLGLPPGRYLFLAQPKNSDKLNLVVKWNDWDWRLGAKEDLDIFLYAVDRLKNEVRDIPEAQSEISQRGAMDPVERLSINVVPGAYYAVAIKAVRLTRPIKVHVYAGDAEHVSCCS